MGREEWKGRVGGERRGRVRGERKGRAAGGERTGGVVEKRMCEWDRQCRGGRRRHRMRKDGEIWRGKGCQV